jgi:hypothetical protein
VLVAARCVALVGVHWGRTRPVVKPIVGNLQSCTRMVGVCDTMPTRGLS